VMAGSRQGTSTSRIGLPSFLLCREARREPSRSAQCAEWADARQDAGKRVPQALLVLHEALGEKGVKVQRVSSHPSLTLPRPGEGSGTYRISCCDMGFSDREGLRFVSDGGGRGGELDGARLQVPGARQERRLDGEPLRLASSLEPGAWHLEPERSDLQQAQLAGPRDGADAAIRAQFAVEIEDVPFHGPYGEIELCRDLFVGQARRQQTQHFHLPIAKRLDQGGGAARGRHAGGLLSFTRRSEQLAHRLRGRYSCRGARPPRGGSRGLCRCLAVRRPVRGPGGCRRAGDRSARPPCDSSA
jgi:hypothetical protein